MKKGIILLSFALIVTFSASAQKFKKIVDEFKGTVTYQTEPLYFVEGSLVMGMILQSDGSRIEAIGVVTKGMGCIKGRETELIFKLSNDEVVSLNSISEFNCNDIAIFALSDDDLKALSDYPVVMIRLENGSKKLTSKFKKHDFIQNAINHQHL